ncbi:MAG: hypothetical protein GKR87_00645 [Kiritimatiellae bacterium]|nr:hypothetical protein [Kiritimatiellia bacterium]
MLLIDALGNRSRYEYDGLNRLTSSMNDLTDDGTGSGNFIDIITISRVWDDSSRLTSITDDNGNTTTYGYDPLDREVLTIYADGTTHSSFYDVYDNLVQSIDANGSIMSNIYDQLDRLMAKNVLPGPGISSNTLFESCQYDGLSRIIYVQDNDSVITRSYDSLSYIIQEVLNGETNSCTYDGVDNMLSCIYPGGRVVTCTYDELERKQSITDQNGLVATYDYIGPTRAERREYGNGTRTDFAYVQTQLTSAKPKLSIISLGVLYSKHFLGLLFSNSTAQLN